MTHVPERTPMRHKNTGKAPFHTFIFTGILSILIILPALSFAEDSLTIGLLPEMNVFKQKKRFEPLAELLSKEMNIPVKLSILSRYGNIVDRFKEQQFDAAFLGSFTGAICITQLDVEPLARPINKDNTSTYFGQIFVRKDSGISSVSQMKGKTFAFVERATTAGYLFPLAYLQRFDVRDLDSFFTSYYFTGSHDAAIQSVLSGQADIGAAKNTVYDLVSKAEPRIDKELTILASSPRVPSNGLCVRPDMIHARKERLRETLLQLHNSADGQLALKAMGAQRFVNTAKQDYQPVFDLAQEAGIDLKAYHYNNK